MHMLVRDSGTIDEIEVSAGLNVLEALQQKGVVVDAPCGGRGKCKKCRMLMADEQGVSYRLACQTPVSDGLEVTVEHSREMSVSMGSQLERWPAKGEQDRYGFSIDVGTTTVVIRLHDLHTGTILGALGCSNPQLAFGADVISRISASDEEGLASMAALLGDALVKMAEKLLKNNAVDSQNVTHVVLVGNTTMELIGASINPTPIGASPFKAPTLFGDVIDYDPFARAGIAGGKVLFAPCVAAYVGGDITAGLLASDMLRKKKLTLLLDLGTNGEMALGNEGGITCCATAAGPVFEGANIKYGMPAYPGAISKVALTDAGAFECEVIGGGAGVGICGTGLFDIAAILIETGIVDETGRIVDEDELDRSRTRGIERHLCEEDGQPAVRLTDRVLITQKDIRSLQLAKASVCAGVLTMMQTRDAAFGDIGELLIAGGFGEYLDLRAAAVVGIFPGELLERARSVGNTAIEGASALLVNSDAREEIKAVMRQCEYIELSTSATFNGLYVDQMMFE